VEDEEGEREGKPSRNTSLSLAHTRAHTLAGGVREMHWSLIDSQRGGGQGGGEKILSASVMKHLPFRKANGEDVEWNGMECGRIVDNHVRGKNSSADREGIAHLLRADGSLSLSRSNL